MFSFIPVIITSIMNEFSFLFVCFMVFSGGVLMLGIILLLIMLQDFLPEAHPTIPTLGAYDILHPTYDDFIFFLTQE